MSNRKRKPITRLHPIERAILRRNWTRQAVDAAVHALVGDNVPELLGKCGSLFWVVLHATRSPHACADAPERRVIRGAVQVLGELVGRDSITYAQRTAITVAIEAVERLGPRVNPDDLFVSAVGLQALAAERAISLADFPQ